MALLYADSFEHQDSTRYDAYGDQGSQFVTGRNGQGMRIGDRNQIGQGGMFAALQNIPGFTGDTLIIGIAVNPALNLSTGRLLRFYSGGFAGTVVMEIAVSGTGQLDLLNATGTFISGVGQLIETSWHWVEAKITFHGSTGYAELRLDGEILDTFSGNTGSTVDFDAFSLGGGDSSWVDWDYYIDDLVIMDGSGAGSNDFTGPVWVQYLSPNDNGAVSLLTGSDADQTDNYDNVNETVPDSTDYNGSTGIGDYDYYALANLSGLVSYTVYGVQVVGQMGRNSGAASFGRLIATDGTSTSYGEIEALSSSFTYEFLQLPVTPSGTTWTQGAFSDLQVGYQVTGATGV